MFSIAVTGGIACGKSLFGQMLADWGADGVDADEIVRSLHLPGGKGAEKVAASFGSDYLLPDGGTDRRRLGNLIFSDASARARLDDLLHPIVRDELLIWKSQPSATPFKVAQIPLLFEVGWEKDWDLSVCINAPENVRLERLCARGLSREQAQERIVAQMTSAQRAAKADIVINNDATITELKVSAQRLFHYLEQKST